MTPSVSRMTASGSDGDDQKAREPEGEFGFTAIHRDLFGEHAPIFELSRSLIILAEPLRLWPFHRSALEISSAGGGRIQQL